MAPSSKKQRGRDKKRQTSAAASASATASATATASASGSDNDYCSAIVTKDYTEGFPPSDFYQRGVNFATEGKWENIKGLMKQGAEAGCVPSMVHYGSTLTNEGIHNIHLVLPWALEAAIRGHTAVTLLLVTECYRDAPLRPQSLCIYWWEMVKNREDFLNHPYQIEDRKQFLEDGKEIKQGECEKCHVCYREDSEFVDLKTCDGCKIYSYCSRNCQTIHWEDEDMKHKAECNQHKILMKYHKPYANEIQKAIKRGDDPKTITSLQTLRNKLGLTRPREEYEEYRNLYHASSSALDPRTLLIPRNNGTVYVGSSPETI
jgi:hypothetical protein